jgi:hypothetical protein
VVAVCKGVVRFFFIGARRLLIRGSEGDHCAVGPPGELLDARRRIRDLLRIATAHRQDENLILGVCGGRQERKAVTGR